MEIKSLVMQLDFCKEMMVKLGQEIKNSLAKHPDASLFTSLCGAGAAFAARLLTAGLRDRFSIAEDVASYLASHRSQSRAARVALWFDLGLAANTCCKRFTLLPGPL